MTEIQKIIAVLEDLKVSQLDIYDFEKESPFYDYFAIATANPRQTEAIIGKLKERLGQQAIRSVEKSKDWSLIDCYHTIVHIFSQEGRGYYQLDDQLLDVKKVI